MKYYTEKELKNLIAEYENTYNIYLNSFGELSIFEELRYCIAEGTSPEQQLDYIFEEAIPNGLREESILIDS